MEQHKINEDFISDAESMLMEANGCDAIAKVYQELTTKYQLDKKTHESEVELQAISDRKTQLDVAVQNLSTTIYHCNETSKQPVK